MKQVLFVAVCLGVLACVFSTIPTTTPTTITVPTNTTMPTITTSQAPSNSNATTHSGMNVTTTGTNGAESVCRTTGLLMVAAIALDRLFH